MTTTPYRLLQLTLAVFGFVFLLLYPLSVVWPSGWAWHHGAPHESRVLHDDRRPVRDLGVFLSTRREVRRPTSASSGSWCGLDVVHAA